MKLTLILWAITGAFAYVPGEKDFLSDALLRELVVSGMNKDLPGLAYFDYPDTRLPLGGRSLGKDMEEEPLFPLDYDTGGGGEFNVHPSLRDQEFLEHSSLWGNQYVSGGAGEGKQRLKPEGSVKNRQEVKTDGTLPAYCNPPNPCPLGYSAQQGCIEDFENTASFSRRYQAAQDCMCDSEHMFDCPSFADTGADDTVERFNDLDFNQFIQHTMQMDPALQHKNLVAKKFNYRSKAPKENPFLTGERLPVAAKKGHHVEY